MIHFNGVTDEPYAFGSRQALLSNVDLDIPVGRYALLSPAPELHRQIVDVLCGLRPPRQGFVKHDGNVSWAIGRQGFIRGKANGLSMIDFVSEMYEIDADATHELVADLVSDPRTLAKPMEHWPLYARQEFSFALALAPAFDVYVIEGAIPFEPCRFTRLWLALFEERLVGRTLILSSYRQNQLADYCFKGLIYERSALSIEDDLDQCIRRFPRDDQGANPAQATTSSEAASMRAESASEGRSEIERRRRERQSALRERRRHRWINTLIVLAPVACALAYLLLFATPRYEAESRFSCSRPPGSKAAGAAASLLTTGNAGGMLGGFVDGWAVADFLKSRDAMQQLDKKVGLRQYLIRAGMDPVNHLAEDSSEDDLYRAYQASVKVSFNALEQIDVLRVSAFSSEDAALLSRALIELAESFVSSMNEKGVADKLKVSEEAVKLAEQKALAARETLTAWRTTHGNIDPTATVTMLLNLSSQLEGELNTAQINLDKIRALGNKDHFMLRPAEMQVASLKKRIAAVRQRLSGAGNTEAKQLKSYEALRNAQAFADSNLTLAQQTYQQAMTDTLRLQRYLSIIAQPVPTDRPSSPRTGILLLQALALGFVLMFIARVALALLRGLRHG